MDCPECGGEGSFEARFLDEVDLRRYDEVDCPLCKGEGIRNGKPALPVTAMGKWIAAMLTKLTWAITRKLNVLPARDGGKLTVKNAALAMATAQCNAVLLRASITGGKGGARPADGPAGL